MVACKPAGMAVHPAPGSWNNTLVQRIRERYASQGRSVPRVDPISRLDRGTSGLVLLVCDPAVHPALHRQVVRREIKREYSCLVRGRPLFIETEVNVPIGRHWSDYKRMAAYDLSLPEAEAWGARAAVTHLRVLERFRHAALLSAVLETGRMHQIRVHCQFIRHPVIGDPVYRGEPRPIVSGSDPGSGNGEPPLQWQCLHADRLEFRHPVTGEMLVLTTPLPLHFAAILHRYREEAGSNGDVDPTESSGPATGQRSLPG